jgi:alanyl-tRNA synthetase
LATAKRITGVRAVFGETYPDPVRVVSIGQPVADLLASPENPAWKELSVEFCGGTHLMNTSAAAGFAIISEEAVAKGIRRIVALTGVPARAAAESAQHMAARVHDAARLNGEPLQREVAEILREIDTMTMPVTSKDELRKTVGQLQERLKAGQKEAAAAAKQQAVGLARQIADSALTSGDQVITTTIELGSDRGALEQAIKTIRDKCPRAAVMLFSADESDPAGPKVSVMASVPEELVKRGLSAGDWLREATTILGGKGGGRPDAAQGAGTNVGKIKDAIAAARSTATRKVM